MRRCALGDHGGRACECDHRMRGAGGERRRAESPSAVDMRSEPAAVAASERPESAPLIAERCRLNCIAEGTNWAADFQGVRCAALAEHRGSSGKDTPRVIDQPEGVAP